MRKNATMKVIPVIDLFAGPGGLSYGFAGFKSADVNFRIALSIEKDEVAHRTLLLRAFLRQFQMAPDSYFKYIRGEASLEDMQDEFPQQWERARAEAKRWELGKEPFSRVSASISAALRETRDWILLGGPPCQAYSLAGRSRMKNESAFEKDHRHTLYVEYLKIVAVHAPAVFVMENVKGILSSKHGARDEASIFRQIIKDLRKPSDALKSLGELRKYLPSVAATYKIYSFSMPGESDSLRPRDFVVRSEEWGIPQRRHRVILLGVRDDVPVAPLTLGDLFQREAVAIEDVIGSMPYIRSRVSGKDSEGKWKEALLACAKLRSPKLPRAVSQRMKAVARGLIPPVRVGGRFISGAGQYRAARLTDWYANDRVGGVIQHEARQHMPKDLMRYFFAACSAATLGKSARLSEFPRQLLPKHRNAKSRKGKLDFADRFRVQISSQPSTTITSHISKDGHYYIHYDATQCRSLTVREAARLQTFPDDYFFEGSRTQQYHQVGNAVPPLLARKLAEVVARMFGSESARQLANEQKARQFTKTAAKALA